MAVGDPARSRLLFNRTVAVDGFSIFFEILFLSLTLLVLMLAPAYLDRRRIQRGEFYILLVAALAGMILMVSATSLMTVFIGLELLSDRAVHTQRVPASRSGPRKRASSTC